MALSYNDAEGELNDFVIRLIGKKTSRDYMDIGTTISRCCNERNTEMIASKLIISLYNKDIKMKPGRLLPTS